MSAYSQVSRSSYLTYPVRQAQPTGHHDDCPCETCMAEFGAQRQSAHMHKRYIECAVCRERIRVNGGDVKLKKRRLNAITRHFALKHAFQQKEPTNAQP
jgi:DNA-directed RNA polymerase subunit RPC12/RpoP